MKKISIYLIGLAGMLVSLTTSCDDFLVQDHPTDIYDDLWWNIEEDATKGLFRGYVGIPDGLSGRNIMFLDALSDQLVARQSTLGQYESFVRGIQASDWDKSKHIYTDNYKTIRRVNRLLQNIDRVYMDEELKQRYILEGRALRAYYHMELSMLFGDVPIVTTSLAPEESKMKRNTKEEVYAFIMSEFADCAKGLPKSYTFAERTRITSGIVNSLMSRLALFYQKFDDARIFALAVINSGEYELYSSSNAANSYSDLFKYVAEMNKERIFYKEDGNSGAFNTIAPPSEGGKCVLSPTSSIVDAYQLKDGRSLDELPNDSAEIFYRDPNHKNMRDPRLKASIMLPGDVFMSSKIDPFDNSSTNANRIGNQNATVTGYWVKKYLDERDKTGSRGLDFMIIRYAEVLLNYAEALVEMEQWDHPDVLKYVNMIRKRATMPEATLTKYNSKEKMRQLIRQERTVELAFEGVHYYDIRRWGTWEKLMNGTVYGAFNPQTGSRIEVEMRSTNGQRSFWWPIPEVEMLANPNMTQNPGY